MTTIAPNYFSLDDPLRLSGTVSVGVMAGHRVLELGEDLFRLGYKIPKGQSYFIKALPAPLKLLLTAGALSTMLTDSVDAGDRLINDPGSNKINDALILAGGCVTAASLLAGAAVSFGVASPLFLRGLTLSTIAGLAIDFGGFAYGALGTNATWQQNLFQLVALLVFNGGREERRAIKRSFFGATPHDFHKGYALIPGGEFEGQTITPFWMKKTPVTNAEWKKGIEPLGNERFVVLKHHDQTGEMRFVKKGTTFQEVMEEEGVYNLKDLNFDLGDVMMSGALRFLKMVDAPSAKYDEPENKRFFSGENQPVVGVSYFHAEAWCLLQTQNSNGRVRYDLPTDRQYYYVASDRGTKEYGTPNGKLYDENGKKLAHIHEYNNGKGTTVAVDDSRYPKAEELPFGVQTTGNVWRWIKLNLQEAYCHGLRGGSWYNNPDFGHAAFREDRFLSDGYGVGVGFSPVRGASGL